MLRIAIVGAGPAGASAGRHLARRGFEVVLLDKAQFPRDKPCGDWLTPMALQELALLGLPMALLRERARGSALITSTVLRAPSGQESQVAIGQGMGSPGLCVPRMQLDTLVLAQALEAGCSFRHQAVAVVDPSASELQDYDLVVDARGSATGTANAAGLRGYWELPRTPDVEVRAAEISLRADAQCPRGYGWVFPVKVQAETVTFNLGVGMWKADIGPGQGPREQLSRFLAQDPLAQALDRQAIAREGLRGFPLAMGGWQAQVAHGRLLRIGDAAHLADPLTGDGIGNALLSGRLLAQALADVARQGRQAPFAHAWQACYARQLQPELRRAWMLRRLLESTRVKNLATHALQRGPGRLRRSLHGALFGLSSYKDALW